MTGALPISISASDISSSLSQLAGTQGSIALHFRRGWSVARNELRSLVEPERRMDRWPRVQRSLGGSSATEPESSDRITSSPFRFSPGVKYASRSRSSAGPKYSLAHLLVVNSQLGCIERTRNRSTRREFRGWPGAHAHTRHAAIGV